MQERRSCDKTISYTGCWASVDQLTELLTATTPHFTECHSTSPAAFSIAYSSGLLSTSHLNLPFPFGWRAMSHRMAGISGSSMVVATKKNHKLTTAVPIVEDEPKQGVLCSLAL